MHFLLGARHVMYGIGTTVALVGCGAPSSNADGSASTSSAVTSGGAVVSAIGSRCLDDSRDLTANGNEIQLWACNGTAAQSWSLEGGALVGPGGKCLDIRDDAQVPGGKVQLYACNGTNAQKWTIDGSAIKSTSGLCLDVTGGVNANGTPIDVATCNGSSSQAWTVAGQSSSPPPNEKSIREWVKCDGTTDDAVGAAAAFAAAKNGAFTLLVDCPVFLHMGSDRTRPIFIDDGTAVTFSGAGKFTVDNVLEPAFAIMASKNVTLTDWTIEYAGIVPVTVPGGTGPGGQWNDVVATAWLEANRGIKGANSIWQGLVNTSALFFIAGAASNITVKGLTATAYSVTEGYRFIPAVAAFAVNWKDNQTVSVATSANTAGPSNVTFEDVTLDGTLMGFVGSGLSSSTFSNITSKHYADLQDAEGKNVGGVDKWFAPPHLFYLSQSSLAGDNAHLTITNVVDAPTAISATDNGDRVGSARDTPGHSGSGVAYSLKLACSDCTVSNYATNRPDGFMDCLQLNDTTVENVTASFNSAFISGLYPGMRFPEAYDGLTFDNLRITDVATTSQSQPIGSSGGKSNLLFENTNLYLNSLKAGLSPFTTNDDQAAASLRTYHLKSPEEVIEVGPNGKID